MSHNVQKYNKQVYLRVSEAQRCRVHSTLVMPVFQSEERDTPIGIFELVQSDRDVVFPAVIQWLQSCLEVRPPLQLPPSCCCSPAATSTHRRPARLWAIRGSSRRRIAAAA
jgi:hypothetical protein